MENKFEKVIQKIDPKKHYVLACSFGPDSMCLFALLLKSKAKFVVCHVNYHRRKEASQEEDSLRKFCDLHNIPFYLKHARYQKRYGNFQSWAREKRYQFFNEIYLLNQSDALLVGHQQDDVIETYLLQKKRQTTVFAYGILPKNRIIDMNVERPILDLTKYETEEYCIRNNIPYAVDSSNFKPVYTRNVIRLESVSRMSDEARKKILEEIGARNSQLLREKSELDKKLEPYTSIELQDVKDLSENNKYYVFYRLVTRFLPPRRFDIKLFNEIKKMLSSTKPNMRLHLQKKEYLMKEYKKFYVADFSALKPYSITVHHPQEISADFFIARLKEEMPHRNITKSDWPLTIRSPKPNDQYRIKDYDVEVRRLFIDWKMPSVLREIWPVITNKKGTIIYIPRYHSDYVSDGINDFEVIVPFLPPTDARIS